MQKDPRITLFDCGCSVLELHGITYALVPSKGVCRGGSCLVYHAVRKDPNRSSRDRKVIIKEFYPYHKDSGSWRKPDGSLVLPDTNEIKVKRELFEHSYDYFTELYNLGMDNNTVKPETISNTASGNSVYMVVDHSSGITLDEYLASEPSLFDFFKLLKNLAGVLSVLHEKGYIHMDVKPSNILVLATNPAASNVRDMCRLLDTDSFLHKSVFGEEDPQIPLSMSRGYAAPEVHELGRRIRNLPVDLLEKFEEIGERVDIYSFGAVVYEFIFGTTPSYPYETDHSYEDQLETQLQKKSEYIPYKAIFLIRDLLKKTLAKDPYDRYETMSEIEAEIEKILKLVDDKSIRILDNCRRNSDKILGREEKLQELREKLTGVRPQGDCGRVVIIIGIGGIGKSSLAREWAAAYAEEYDIKAEVSAASLREAVNQIRIIPDPTDGIQDPDKRFKEKFELIQNLCKEYRTLLIVNDYDTSDEPDDRWTELGCDVILTSRHDWKNGRYPVLTLSCSDLTPEKTQAIFASYYLQDLEASERYHLEQALQKEAASLMALLEYLNYHPLGIKLMARQMAFLPGDVILPSQMLKILETEGIDEDSLEEFQEEKDSVTRSHNVYGHLATIYRTAFINGRLKSGDLEALRYMTLVVSSTGISIKRFAQWTGLNARYLPRLKQMGWLEYLPAHEDLLDGTKGRGVYVSVLPEDPEESRQYETTKGTYTMPTVIQEVLRKEPDLVCSVENCRKYVRSAIDSEGEMGFTAVRNALYEQRQLLLRLLPEENSEEYARLLVATAEPLISDFIGCDNYDYLRILSIYKKSLAMLKTLPNTYDIQQHCISRIIHCYGFLGDFKAAYILAKEMLDERRKLGLEIDRSYFQQMHTIYEMEFHSGRMMEAIRHMWQLRSLLIEEKRNPDLFAIASASAEIGQMLRKVGHWHPAEQMLLTARKELVRLFYTNDGPLAIELYNRTFVEQGILCLDAMKGSWEASRLLNNALSLSQEFMQPTDLRAGDIHFYLAECGARVNSYHRSTVFEKVVEHRKQALDIYQKQLPPGTFKILLAKILLALDYGEISGMEITRDSLLKEFDTELSHISPRWIKGNPGRNFCKYIQTLANDSAADSQILRMFEFLEEHRKLHLRLYGKDASYLQECEALAKLCEKYDLTEKAAHYRKIMNWE